MTSADFQRASQNQIKKWSRLTQAGFRREDGLFLAEGVKVVEELLKSDWPTEAILTLPEKMTSWEKLISSSAGLDPSALYQLSRSDFKKLSQDKEPEGLMAVVKIKDPLPVMPPSSSIEGHLLIGHEIANPQNLGALVRTARWFGFSGIALGSHCVDWTHPKAIRSSMGAVFHMRIWTDLDLSRLLPEIRKDFALIGSDVRRGVAPHHPAGKAALLLGSESHGLPDSLLAFAAERWHIPGDKRSESLSLPQAAAIMMYEIAK